MRFYKSTALATAAAPSYSTKEEVRMLDSAQAALTGDRQNPLRRSPSADWRCPKCYLPNSGGVTAEVLFSCRQGAACAGQLDRGQSPVALSRQWLTTRRPSRSHADSSSKGKNTSNNNRSRQGAEGRMEPDDSRPRRALPSRMSSSRNLSSKRHCLSSRSSSSSEETSRTHNLASRRPSRSSRSNRHGREGRRRTVPRRTQPRQLPPPQKLQEPPPQPARPPQPPLPAPRQQQQQQQQQGAAWCKARPAGATSAVAARTRSLGCHHRCRRMTPPCSRSNHSLSNRSSRRREKDGAAAPPLREAWRTVAKVPGYQLKSRAGAAYGRLGHNKQDSSQGARRPSPAGTGSRRQDGHCRAHSTQRPE